LFSVFARYGVRIGSTSPKATLADLFGCASACAVVDLPSNIGALLARMPEYWGYTADGLIYGHTLFPFYEPFLPAERAAMVFEAMKGNRGGTIHTRAGIMASSVVMPKFLRFCPDCVKEDKVRRGELYWRRLHQVPCVLVCPQHNKLLLGSSAPMHYLNKHEFIPANEENCACREPEIRYSDSVLEKLNKLADDVNDLLITRNIIGPNDLQKIYLSKLVDLDLATAMGRVYQRELAQAFIDFYGRKFLEAVQSGIQPDYEETWLADIVRKPRKAQHPIRYLLMIRFLGGSVEWLRSTPVIAGPFGKGPWPCLNPAAEHYRKLVVDDLKVSHCYDTKRPVGTFTCSCGFIYSRRGPDRTPEDKYKIGRIKAFGPVWEERLRGLVEQERLGLNEIARRLGADPMTVKKYANLLGLTFHWELRTSAKVETFLCRYPGDQDETKEKSRKEWLALKDQNYASKTELRKLAPGTYAWLYRHDRDWLNHNSPSCNRTNHGDNRVDWPGRDADVLAVVEKAVEDLKEGAGKPNRVSISKVGKLTGTLGLLERHLDKMPLTAEFLMNNVDDMGSYQAKRIAWAAGKIYSDGKPLRAWKIARLSGLRPEFTRSLALVIDSEIRKYLGQGLAEFRCSSSETGTSDPTNWLQ